MHDSHSIIKKNSSHLLGKANTSFLNKFRVIDVIAHKSTSNDDNDFYGRDTDKFVLKKVSSVTSDASDDADIELESLIRLCSGSNISSTHPVSELFHKLQGNIKIDHVLCFRREVIKDAIPYIRMFVGIVVKVEGGIILFYMLLCTRSSDRLMRGSDLIERL